MTRRDAASGPALYEVTIKRHVGPVIRSALTPHGVTRSEFCTILRVGDASLHDLVDLLLLIQEKGWTVEDVYAIEP